MWVDHAASATRWCQETASELQQPITIKADDTRQAKACVFDVLNDVVCAQTQ